MIDAGGEVDLWGLEGVVGREGDAQEEHAGGVRAVRLSKKSATVDYSSRVPEPAVAKACTRKSL